MFTDDMKALYNRSKWALVIRGLFGIALGIYILVRPLESVAAFALVIAIWALVDGFVNIARAVELRAVAPHWWVMLLTGIVSVLFGVAALYYYPGPSLSFAVLWVALWMISAGLMAAYVAMLERSAHLSWGWTMVLGVVAIAAGILAVMYPGITLGGLMGVIGGFGLISGIAMLVAAGKMQSVQSRVGGAMHAAART